MNQLPRPTLRRQANRYMRAAFGVLPKRLRFAAYRHIVDCDPAPSPRLELKIAETQQELEACFALLHDAYVSSGFMQPHPSGLRVTPYHALPTTTTLCAKFDGQVAGTLSIVREGVFGFPMQSAFELSAVRASEGRIAEISALAVHPNFRRTGGSILFPLMKFMYEYCTQYFDTRHLVIAVNPNRIELYEALLMFERLQAQAIDRYDFANGAPAIGATLDLQTAPQQYMGVYGRRSERRDLHRYFVDTRLPNIKQPTRNFYTSNDPVLTPALLDYFFNQRTDVMARLDPRRLHLLHSVYGGDEWARVLPGPAPLGADARSLRQHHRFSMKCPATLEHRVGNVGATQHATLIELSLHGFQARTIRPLAIGTRCTVRVALGEGQHSHVEALLMRHVPSASGHFNGFRVDCPDAVWRHCVSALAGSDTHADLSRQSPPASPVTTPAASDTLSDLLVA